MESKHLFALILLIATATAYPQNWDQQNLNWNQQNPNWNQQNPNWNQPTPSTFIRGQPIENRVSSTTPTPTTSSPRFLACVQSCPATSEYNPICGSDNVNYFNEGKFNCAVSCGQNVRRLHLGICSTT